MKFNLQGLLVEKIEHRIIVGTVAFLGIMVLVGWIAINENGRMAAFERQYVARSVERGAYLFAHNCASCHGTNGLGLVGVAPALNSPQFFGHDFLGSITRQRNALTQELNAGVTDARRAEIETTLAALDIEQTAIVSQMQSAIDRGYDPAEFSRLGQLGREETLASYINTTLVHGRPTSISYWPQAMAAWAQVAGGPLRPDQIGDLTNFILNYDRGSEWTIDDLLAVNQYPKVPVDGAIVAELMANAEPTVGEQTVLADLMIGLQEVTGDPQNGMTLYNGALACSGCHMNAAVAPLTQGTWTRVQQVRLLEPQFADYTPEMYIVESIIHPNDYISPGYPANIMPNNYGSRLTYQQLADLLAYISTQDQPID